MARSRRGARALRARARHVWEWASTDEAETDPDVVLACAGDVATLETIAAAWLIHQFAPELKVRVVNVVDLMMLFPKKSIRTVSSGDAFVELFTADTDVVFAFHGYPRAVHQILHGRPSPARFHVRGFQEQGRRRRRSTWSCSTR